jgi:hypothetical protein
MKDTNPALTSERTRTSAARPHGRDRRRALIVSLLFLSGLGGLALAVTWATGMLSPNALRSSAALEHRTGRIVATVNGRCQQLTFHNDSGTVSNTGSPCTTEEGAPTRTGPTRRLDAISKSFLGRD